VVLRRPPRGAVVIAVLVAYIVARRLVPFGSALGFLAMAPFVIPGIVMAIGFYAAYAPPPLALYGTALIIILAFTARFLPIAFANSSAAVRACIRRWRRPRASWAAGACSPSAHHRAADQAA
jgi:ABC-type Fe3+ transport system permease subunit